MINMTKNKLYRVGSVFRLVLLALLFVLPSLSYAAVTNVSILYGWNGTNFVPVQVTSDGSLKTNLNLSESSGINPQVNNTYDLGTASLIWANLYVRSIRGGSGPLSLFAGGNEIITLLANGNVGIGTTTPEQNLVVIGTANLSGGLMTPNVTFADGTLQTSAATGTNVSLLYGVNQSNTAQQVPLQIDDGALKLAVEQSTATATTANSLNAGATGSDLTLSDRLNVTGTTANSTFSGDVRILGTLYGGSPLKISGLNVTDGNLFVTGALVVNSTTITGASASGWTISGNNVYNDTLGVLFGIGTLSPTALLHISGTSSANNISLNVNNTLYVNVSSNRVAIGTSSPAATLHVVSPAIPTG